MLAVKKELPVTHPQPVASSKLVGIVMAERFTGWVFYVFWGVLLT